MAYELNPEYGELYGAQKDELLKALSDLLSKEETSYGARGVSGRAKAESRESALDNLLRQLGTIKGEYGVRQLGREQRLEDVAGARKHETRKTYAQWAEQRKAATTAFERQKELINLQEQMARERESRAKKDARKNMIRSTLMNIGTGGISGMLMPGAVGAKGRPATGFLRGMAVGAPAVGTSAAYNWMFPKATTPTTRPYSPTRAGGGYKLQTDEYNKLLRMIMGGKSSYGV